MKKRFSQKITLIPLFTIIFSTQLLAHPGKLDGNSGHSDKKNVSQLGSYHYHCNSSDAHLHNDEDCIYTDTTSQPIASTSPINKNVQLSLDNEIFTLQGISLNNSTLVEMRPLCEKLNISLNYDANTSSITCNKDTVKFVLTIGKSELLKDGITSPIATAPILYNGKTMLPVRVVAEAINKTVDYDSSTDIITIK